MPGETQEGRIVKSHTVGGGEKGGTILSQRGIMIRAILSIKGDGIAIQGFKNGREIITPSVECNDGPVRLLEFDASIKRRSEHCQTTATEEDGNGKLHLTTTQPRNQDEGRHGVLSSWFLVRGS